MLRNLRRTVQHLNRSYYFTSAEPSVKFSRYRAHLQVSKKYFLNSTRQIRSNLESISNAKFDWLQFFISILPIFRLERFLICPAWRHQLLKPTLRSAFSLSKSFVKEKFPFELWRKFSGTERNARRNFGIGVDFGPNFERNFDFRV